MSAEAKGGQLPVSESVMTAIDALVVARTEQSARKGDPYPMHRKAADDAVHVAQVKLTMALDQMAAAPTAGSAAPHGGRQEREASALLRELLEAQSAWNPGGNLHARNEADMAKERRLNDARQRARAYLAGAKAPEPLQVWFGSMPESNGKTNWTAILHRGDLAEGITLDRSEYHDRVRYEADRARFLIGELSEEPDILAYDPELRSPATEGASRG